MRHLRIFVASAGIALATPVIAQQVSGDSTVALIGAGDDDRSERNPRLGLLGLLGLIGALGLLRREPNIHIDMRRDRRP